MSESKQRRSALGVSRRGFLRASAAGAGAAAALSLARGAHAAGSDILRVGLIGCGGRGAGAAVNALTAEPGTRLVALADAFPEAVAGALERIKQAVPERGQQIAVGRERCFAGFDAYQKLIASGVDVVLLATPSHFHPIHMKAGIEAGKHVFCEKPHAVDAPGVRTVLAVAEEARRKNLSLVSGLCARYNLGYRETVRRILDGAIGDIIAIQESYLAGASFHVPRKPTFTEMEFQLRNWHRFAWLSGDWTGLMLIHGLDRAAWVLRDEPPRRAWGLGGKSGHPAGSFGDTFDFHAVVFEYASGVRMFAYTRQDAGGAFNEVSDWILGAKGRANIDAMRIEVPGKSPWRYSGPMTSMYDVEMQEMLSGIRAGRPLNNGTYMARSTMLAVMARAVTYTGQAVSWNDMMQSEEKLAPARYAFDADPPILPDKNGRYPAPIPGLTRFS